MKRQPGMFDIIALRNKPTLAETAAEWFHGKWSIPAETYLESLQEGIKNHDNIPQWYAALDAKGKIVAGCGLIENDFHDRKDLTPNICALYVEPSCRNHGIAKSMLGFICGDVHRLGLKKVYLLTNHTDFYEKCGWKYLCMVTGDDGSEERVYYAETKE